MDLHIEDDGANPPKSWSLLVDGEKPWASDLPTIKMGRRVIIVKLPGGGDSKWMEYEFLVPDDCDSGIYNGKVRVYSIIVPSTELRRSYLCNCIED